jgi:hypothetical protein
MSQHDPWVVQEKKEFTPVPDGNYMTQFRGVDVVQVDGKAKWRWTWEVQGGALVGKQATALTDQNINPATLPGRLIAGLLGRPLKAGEHVKSLVDACVGKSYMVGVQPGPQGGKSGVRSCGQPPAM